MIPTKKLLFAFLTFGLIISTLVGCGDSTDSSTFFDAETAADLAESYEIGDEVIEFGNYVSAGEYQDAILVYNNSILGNAVWELQAQEYLIDSLESAFWDYNDGDISVESANAIFSCVQRVDESLCIISSQLSDLKSNYDALTQSKNFYNDGLEKMEQGDYEAAMYAFDSVSHIDTNYDDACEKSGTSLDMYVQTGIETARDQIEAGAYETVEGILTQISLVAGWHEEFDSLIIEAATLAAEQDVRNALETEGYPVAQDVYNRHTENVNVNFSVEMISALETGKAEWRKSVIAQSNELAVQEQYPQAIALVEDALLILVEDAEFLNQLDVLNEGHSDYLRRTSPVNLTDISAYKEEGYMGSNSNDKDIFGNIYATVLWSEDGSYTWRIDDLYTTFTGTAYIPSTDTDDSGTIRVFGDGVELYSATITGGTDPTSFSIDISGVYDLTISISSDWGVHSRIGDPILTP